MDGKVGSNILRVSMCQSSHREFEQGLLIASYLGQTLQAAEYSLGLLNKVARKQAWLSRLDAELSLWAVVLVASEFPGKMECSSEV